MSDVPGGDDDADRSDGVDSDGVDDDALADAILASYTSSIPVIRSDGQPEPPAPSEPEPPAPSEPAPAGASEPEPAGPSDAETERLFAEATSWTDWNPSDSAPEATRVETDQVETDEEDETPRTVWDLGDPGGYEGFDFPPPDDAEPIDLLSDAAPKPWDRLPAPAPSAKQDDGEDWRSGDERVTPFDPLPYPSDAQEPWTKLVEPEPDASVPSAEPGADPTREPGWRPPTHWAPPSSWEPPAESGADLFPAPTPATPTPIVPAPSAHADPPDDSDRSGDDEPDADQPDHRPGKDRPGDDEGGGDQPEDETDDDETGDGPPSEPPVGGSGGTATPWFDLASAPPPDASTVVPPPAPEQLAPEPESTESDPPAALTVAGLPPGTVRTTIAPPAPLPAVDGPLGVFELERSGVEPTPSDRRASRATRLFWIWFAPNASVLSIATGAVLFGMGMSLRQAVVATLGGVALSFLPLGLGTLAGRWSGQPTLVVSRAAFGVVGNIVPSLLAVLSRAVWAGALLWVVGESVRAGIVRAGGGDGATWSLVGVVLGALVAGAAAVVGYGLVSRVQPILTALTAVLVAAVVALTAGRVDLGRALSVGDGPWVLVASGVVLVFTFVGLAWVQSSADVARYQSARGTGSSAMLAASLGAGVPALALIAWGAVLAASSPALARGLASSPIDALTGILPTWFPIPLLAGAVLASLAGVVLAGYSGGFALQAAGLPASRAVATVLALVLAAAVAVLLVLSGADARALGRDVLTTLAVPVAAWAGIFAAEMMIRNRRFHTSSLLARGGIYPDVRLGNLVSVVVVSAVGLGFCSATVPWLAWQGWFLPLVGVPVDGVLGQSDVGVLIALGLGLLVPVLSSVPAIRRQENVRTEVRVAAP